MKTYLVVGAFPPPVGGTTVSLQALANHLVAGGERVLRVDCAPGGRSMAGALLHAVAESWRRAGECDVVSVHFSDRATKWAGPLFWAVARLRGRPFVFRQFGGEFQRTFAGLNSVHRWLLRRTVLSADAVLFQTVAQVSALERFCRKRPSWFPTARAMPAERYGAGFATGGRETLECVYVGHVRRDKGVLDAAAAVAAVPNARFHVYGPLVDIRADEIVAFGAEYHGEAATVAVPGILSASDVLLFPTRYRGEGYSGVLVEAALVGLPVIATRWQALPEMFPNDELIWIDSGSAELMAARIRSVASRQVDLIAASRRMALRGAVFDSRQVFENFRNICNRICDEKAMAGRAETGR